MQNHEKRLEDIYNIEFGSYLSVKEADRYFHQIGGKLLKWSDLKYRPPGICKIPFEGSTERHLKGKGRCVSEQLKQDSIGKDRPNTTWWHVCTETWELSNVSSISEVPRQTLHFTGDLESHSSYTSLHSQSSNFSPPLSLSALPCVPSLFLPYSSVSHFSVTLISTLISQHSFPLYHLHSASFHYPLHASIRPLRATREHSILHHGNLYFQSL